MNEYLKYEFKMLVYKAIICIIFLLGVYIYELKLV